LRPAAAKPTEGREPALERGPENQKGSDAVYHVTSRGHQRESIYRDDANWQARLDVIAQAADRFDAQVLAYCLMDKALGAAHASGQSVAADAASQRRLYPRSATWRRVSSGLSPQSCG